MTKKTIQKNIPQGWQEILLGSFLAKEKGSLPKNLKEEKMDNSFVPYLTINTIDGGIPKYAQKFDGTIANKDDLLVVADGSGSGRLYRGYEGLVSSTFFKVSSIDKSKITNDFLSIVFSYLNFMRSGFRKGGAIPHFDYKQLDNIKIFLPPINEQRKIAEILGAVDEDIAKTQEVIEAAEKLKRGLMQQLFTRGIGHTKFKKTKHGEIPEKWKVSKINNHVIHVGSGATPRGGSKVYLTEGIPFIRSQNVYFLGLIQKDLAYINESTHKHMTRSRVSPNDILLNITGASIGRACIVPVDLLNANVNQHVCIIRPSKDLFFQYLFYFLQSQKGQDQIFKFQIGGNREGLNFQQIRSIEFPFPENIKEQQNIAEILSAVDEKILVNKKLKEKLTFLKKGLMQDLLSGKVRTI